MTDTLFQKDLLFNRRWFKIDDEGLSVTSKSLTSSSEVFVKFEDIGVKIIKSKGGKKGWLIATIIFLLLSAGMFFFEKSGGDTDKNAFMVYLILAIISGIIFLLTFKSSFYLADNNNQNAIRFLIDKPSKEELSDFINSLKLERKKVLIAKYGQITNLLSYEQQLNSLNWLSSAQALSKEEYESKVAQLNSLFRKSNPIIGFRSTDE
jgi:hypothetical protein